MRTGRLLALAAALGVAVACGMKTPPVPPAEETAMLNPVAVAGVEDADLRRLLSEQWEYTMLRSPTWATSLGDHRYDDLIGELTPGSFERDRRERTGWTRRGEAIGQHELSAADRTTLQLFLWERRVDEAQDICAYETWSFGPTNNPVAEFDYLPEGHPVITPVDGQNLIARYRAIPRYVDENIANLRRGLPAGRVGNATSTKLTIAMVADQLAKPIAEWPMATPVTAEHPDWSADDLAAFRLAIPTVLESEVRPAFEKYRAFLETEVLPKARPDEKSGLAYFPDGDACYRAAILRHTTLAKSPDEVHAIGLAELERLHGQMRELGKKLFGTDDLAAIFERLRTDPSMYFANGDEIVAKAQASLDRARAAIPQFFGRLPKTDCVVRIIPDYEAPYTYVAYYRQPRPDGSKPGEYFVNTFEPQTRPRYEAEVLAFHESIPGHHLQIAIAQELPEMPAFRKYAEATAYTEGWALYTETLADEMGLYSGDLDRMGMLSFQSWRASRLVVDSGVHAKGWSREQAEQFMRDNTPLALNNIANEVDRYINWPGQALGYKLGQIEILRMRHEAEERLGDRFDLRGFHDVVLGGGAVPLGVLDEHVRAWSP